MLGLDIGTANFVAAREEDGNVIVVLERDAFLDIPDNQATRQMLTNQNVQYAVIGDKLYVVGEDAFRLANVFNKSTRRPMRSGLLSAAELDYLPLVKLIIRGCAGNPREEDELVYFTVPANPVDSEDQTTFHQEVIVKMLGDLGYTAKSVNEAHALACAELADDDYTGIAMSFGSGMCNVSVDYMGVSALTFSIQRGGDWIDEQSARATGLQVSKLTYIKESGIDLSNPRTIYETAIVANYKALIHYLIEQIKYQFESGTGMPTFRNEVPIVCGGGSVLVEGFIELFTEVYESLNFPFDISEIRLADDPMYAVAKGCLAYAMLEQKAGKKKMADTFGKGKKKKAVTKGNRAASEDPIEEEIEQSDEPKRGEGDGPPVEVTKL